MARNKFVFVVTIDGRTHPEVFTTIKSVTHAFNELPYSTLRESFKVSNERAYVHDNKLYRVTRANISRVKGRAGHFAKAQKSGE